MAQLVTIKSQFDSDLRRFSVPQTCTFEALCEHLRSMYKLDTNNFVIKYSDDEGDLISVTTTEELIEAFRLAKDLKPPILRVNVIATKSAPAKEQKECNEYPPLPVSEWDAPVKETKVEVKKEQPKVVEKKEEPKKEKESNEYPPLPVSEWDAPQKKPVLLVSVKIPPKVQLDEVTIPISISAQIQNQCEATTAEVNRYAQETIQTALPLAHAYPVLATNIAAQCKEYSVATAEIAKRLSSLQTEETLRMGETSKEATELSLATMRECQKLSEATAALCLNLSAATLEECKHFSASSNALLVDTKSNLAELSDEIKNKCGELSSEVSARSAQASSDITKLIMNL